MLLLVGLALAPLTRAADEPKPGDQPTPVDDRTFVRKVSETNLAEINLGMLAARLAMNPEVRRYGQRMVDDHTTANEQLNALANKKGFQVASEMVQKHRALSDKLLSLRGQGFDKEYMSNMVTGHKEAVALFEAKSKDAQDPDLKTFATQTLPILQEHLKMAQSLAGTEKTGTDKGPGK
jgi:putative membrane protein